LTRPSNKKAGLNLRMVPQRGQRNGRKREEGEGNKVRRVSQHGKKIY